MNLGDGFASANCLTNSRPIPRFEPVIRMESTFMMIILRLRCAHLEIRSRSGLQFGLPTRACVPGPVYVLYHHSWNARNDFANLGLCHDRRGYSVHPSMRAFCEGQNKIITTICLGSMITISDIARAAYIISILTPTGIKGTK